MDFIYPKQLVKEHRVKEISPTLFEVLGHSVKFQKKKGRTLLICDCDNSSYFGHNQFCIHKLSVLYYLFDNNFYKKMDKLISEYENYKELKLPVSIECFIEELKSIKYLK